MNIPPSAVSAPEKEKVLLFLTEIPDDKSCLTIFDYGTGRQRNNYIFSVFSVTAPAFAVFAVFGSEILFIPKMREGTEIPPDREDHTPAPASVAPRGAAPGDKFLPVESHTAVPAIPRGYFDKHFIGKFLQDRIAFLLPRGNDRGQLPAPALTKGNSSVFEGKKGVIPSAAHIGPGMDMSSPLPYND